MNEYLYISVVLSLLVVALGCLGYISWRYVRLKRIHKFNQQVFAVASVSMFVVDKNKYIVDIFNIEASAMAGSTVDDIVGKHISYFVNDKTSPFNQICTMLNESFDRIIVNRQTEYFHYTVNDANLVAKIKIIEGDSVVSVVSDVTEHTRRANDMINKKQHEINIAFKAGGLVAWSYDVETGIFLSSADNNVIGDLMTYDVLLDLIHPQDREVVSNAFYKIIECKEIHQEFSVRVRNDKHVNQWSSVHAVPSAYDANNRVIKITGSQKNITQEVEIIDELIRLREAAEESNRMKSSFIANMSHEIRTPLNAILGFSSLMITTQDKKEAEEYHNIIEQNSTLLLNIVNDVLSLSKIESKQMEFSMMKIDVYEMLNYLSETVKVKINPAVTMTFDNPRLNIEIESDIDRLTQVLINLLNNALKFTTKGEIHLGYNLLDNGEKIRFYVKDTGIGMSQEDASRIFGMFVKVDNFKQGTGLGLPICESIVRAMNGEIGVDSTLGEGSTFWFIIPTSAQIRDSKLLLSGKHC